ncbi:MAG: helix-turn-helix domain-containing protein [Oscillospiraceae bacterium]|nr:helix-turn-helix domain-containing protein [Oscillospiraceae bacterium]
MSDYQKKGFLTEDFRLFHLRSDGGTRPEFHYHEFYKVLLLVSGSGSYTVEGCRYGVQSGDIVLVGSHSVHRPEIEPGAAYERIILYLSPEFLRRASGPNCDLTECFRGQGGHVLRPGEAERKQLFSLAASLERELGEEGYGQRILCTGAVLELLVRIGRSLLRGESPRPGPLTPANERVAAIIRYLDRHLTEDIAIDDLSERFYLSKYHMMRLFRRETGTTIHGYLTERRLSLARELMLGGMNATDACFRSGWRSYCSFTRAYGKHYGSTPTGRRDAAALADETYE